MATTRMSLPRGPWREDSPEQPAVAEHAAQQVLEPTEPAEDVAQLDGVAAVVSTAARRIGQTS